MTYDITFDELDGPKEVAPLTRADLRALRRARAVLHVEPLAGGRARVGPRPGYVGSIAISDGRRIVVEPKAPIAQLVSLLVLAYQTLAPPQRVGQTLQEEAEPNDWFVLQFVAELEYMLSQGLRRGYVWTTEALPFLRGRLRPMPTALSGSGMLTCEYGDFTEDTVENRLVRSSLEHIALLPHARTLRRRLDDLRSVVSHVRYERPSLRALDRVHLTRLNAHYAPVLRFCRLFLEGSGLSENAGEATTSAFFMPMWRVFERGVGAALRRAGLTIHTGPEYGDRFDHVAGTPERAIILKPDIVAGVRSSPDFVIDTKWSRPTVLRHGVSRFKNDHVYQLATYCTALGCDGMLVYPRFDEDIDVTYRFGGRSITLRTVDLTELDLAALETLAASVKDE